MDYLTVAAGGMLGCVLRYALCAHVDARFGGNTGGTWGVFAANAAGCFAIGVLAGLTHSRWDIHPHLRLFIAVGVLGGFTTFSSYALAALDLFRAHDYLAGLAYLLGSSAAGIALVAAGFWLGRR